MCIAFFFSEKKNDNVFSTLWLLNQTFNLSNLLFQSSFEKFKKSSFKFQDVKRLATDILPNKEVQSICWSIKKKRSSSEFRMFEGWIVVIVIKGISAQVNFDPHKIFFTKFWFLSKLIFYVRSWDKVAPGKARVR